MKLRELLDIMQKVSEQCNCSEVFICGGTPRDKVLNRLDLLSDLDFTTGDKSINTFSTALYKELSKTQSVTTKTMSDGHSSIFMGNLKLDFSSNFIVPNINIDNPTDLNKEIFSRDFTCNSLLMPLDLKTIYDPTKHGLADIKNKVIKTCLAPEITLVNSRNRVVRAIYLACKLGFEIDPSIIEFVKTHPDSVRIASEKTLKEKLEKAFELDSKKADKYITEMNLWKQIPISKKLMPYFVKAQNE